MEKKELAGRVCKAMGWRLYEGLRTENPVYNWMLWPVFDCRVAELLRAEIGRRGLEFIFIAELGDIIIGAGVEVDWQGGGWDLVNATPEQTARAFLKAIEQ